MIEDFFHLPPVSTTPVVHFELRIYMQIFKNIWNGSNDILRGLEESDSLKKTRCWQWHHSIGLALSCARGNFQTYWCRLRPVRGLKLLCQPCFYHLQTIIEMSKTKGQMFWYNFGNKCLVSFSNLSCWEQIVSNWSRNCCPWQNRNGAVSRMCITNVKMAGWLQAITCVFFRI